MRLTPRTALVAVLVALAACGNGGNESVQPESTAAESTRGSTRPETTTSTARELTFPPARDDVEHGAPTWAVVLAGAEAIDGPSLVAAEAAAKDAGYFGGPTDCDQGAKEALGMTSEAQIYTVSVYFDTETVARQALAAFRAQGFAAGVVAEVRTYCLD